MESGSDRCMGTDGLDSEQIYFYKKSKTIKLDVNSHKGLLHLLPMSWPVYDT